MLATLRDIFLCLTPAERRSGLGVLALMLFMASFEVVGVASVMPFLGVLANPQIVESHPILSTVYKSSGLGSREAFLVVLGLLAFVLQVFAAVSTS